MLLIVLYCIHRRVYLNLFKSTQKRRMGMKASKPAANERALLHVQIITLLFPLTVQKYTYPPVSRVHAGSFPVSYRQSSEDFLSQRNEREIRDTSPGGN